MRIKIAKFGLLEDICERGYFREDTLTEDEFQLDIMWMAPESLKEGHFSEKTDVVMCFPV